MSVYWEESGEIDLVRVEARLNTVTAWIKALRLVRHELFLQAKAHIRSGGMSEKEHELLDAYSSLSQLGSMLEEATGEGL